MIFTEKMLFQNFFVLSVFARKEKNFSNLNREFHAIFSICARCMTAMASTATVAAAAAAAAAVVVLSLCMRCCLCLKKH